MEKGWEVKKSGKGGDWLKIQKNFPSGGIHLLPCGGINSVSDCDVAG